MLFLGLQSVVDGLMLGRFVGAHALASVNVVLPCYSLITALSIVIGVGCQTLIGISLGRSDRAEASNALTSLFYFLMGLSVLISGLFILFAEPIVHLLGANDVLTPGSVAYLRVLAPFFPVLAIMFFNDYILKAMGHPLYSSLVLGGTVLLNAGLDLLFVGLWGWEIQGAALSTGIAFTAGVICNLPFLFNRKQVVCLQRGRYKSRLVWKAFYNGSSEGLSELSAAITVFLFNITMMKYLGENGVAAFTVLNYVLFISLNIFLGVSDGIVPVISYNYGAGKSERIRAIVRLAAKTNFIVGGVLFLLLFFWGNLIISLFLKSSETDTLAIASYGVSVYSFAFLLNGLNILASSYFTAIGNAKVSIIISMLRGLVFVAIGILVYPFVFGINAIWYNIPVAEFCTLFVSAWLVRKSFRKLNVLTAK